MRAHIYACACMHAHFSIIMTSLDMNLKKLRKKYFQIFNNKKNQYFHIRGDISNTLSNLPRLYIIERYLVFWIFLPQICQGIAVSSCRQIGKKKYYHPTLNNIKIWSLIPEKMFNWKTHTGVCIIPGQAMHEGVLKETIVLNATCDGGGFWTWTEEGQIQWSEGRGPFKYHAIGCGGGGR